MSYLKLENNAKTTLQATITAGATSLTVVSATKFPDSNFLITIWNSSTYSDPGDDTNMEILLVTAVSGTTFTVTRAQESTVAKAHSSGYAVQMLITAGILEEIQDAIKDNFSELDDTPSSYSGQGLKGVRVKGAEDGVEFYTTTDSDEKIKISSNDTTANYLNGKLVAGTGIALTENNNGANETLSVINSDKGSDAISTHEITYDHSQLHAQNTDNILQVDLSYVPDQYQSDTSDDGGAGGVGGSYARQYTQTFIPSGDVNLYSVKLPIWFWDYGSGYYDFEVEIQTVDGDKKPTGSVLGSKSLPYTSFTHNEYTTVEFVFPSLIALSASITYAIVCKSNMVTTAAYFIADCGGQNLYSDGRELTTIDGGSNWTEHSTRDLAFETYIEGVGVTDLINDGVLKQNLEVDAGKTIDGRDLSVDGTKLDTIETNADITDVANVTTALASITVNAHSDITSAGADIEDAVTKKHTQGTDTTLGSMSADINMNTHKLTGLSIPSSAGDSIRQTAKITEANLETAYDHSQIITGNPHAIDLTDLSTYDHKDLQNLQGGTTNEYYHLNSSEHTELTAWLDDVVLSDGGTLNLGTGKLHLRDTAIGIYSQADTFLDLFADGAVRIGDSSAGAPTNYSKFEPDGTLEFNGAATVFDDLRTPVNVVRVPASKAPTWTAYNGTELLGFSYQAVEGNEEEIYFIIQLPHSYKEGSDIVPHVHWIPNEDTTDDPEVVRWGLEYEWQNINGTFAGSTIIHAEESMTDRSGDHIKTLFSAIDGTGKTISSVVTCRLFRNSSSVNDTFDSGTALALFLEIDFHFEKNTVGSRLINDSK